MLAFTGASTHVCPRPLFERFDRFRQDLSKQRRHGLMPLGATAKRNNSKVCCRGSNNGIVTLSQIERNWPITAKAEAWDFNDLACCSIAEIRLVSLNVGPVTS